MHQKTIQLLNVGRGAYSLLITFQIKECWDVLKYRTHDQILLSCYIKKFLAPMHKKKCQETKPKKFLLVIFRVYIILVKTHFRNACTCIRGAYLHFLGKQTINCCDATGVCNCCNKTHPNTWQYVLLLGGQSTQLTLGWLLPAQHYYEPGRTINARSNLVQCPKSRKS